VAAVAGVATFSDLSIDLAGSDYTLTAAATGRTGATSGTFNISADEVAGIRLSNITPPYPDPALKCSGAISAIVCLSIDEQNPNGGTLTANLTLVDQFGNEVKTGSIIGIDLVAVGDGDVTVNGDKVIPPGTAALSVLTGNSQTSLSFTLKRSNGNNKIVTMTATASVNSTTQTLKVTLSSYNTYP